MKKKKKCKTYLDEEGFTIHECGDNCPHILDDKMGGIFIDPQNRHLFRPKKSPKKPKVKSNKTIKE